MVQNLIILHDKAKSHRCCHGPLALLAMGDFGTSTVLTRYDSMRLRSIFPKVKEPLRRTRYNTRDELIRAIGRSIRNINKDGRADGVRRLPNISQKVINKRGDYIEGSLYKCCTPVNKAMSEISNCCHYFLSNPFTKSKLILHSEADTGRDIGPPAPQWR